MSPKNKGTFGKGKPAIEETDEFVSGVQKIGHRLAPYAIRIAIVLGIVTVGVLAFTIYNWWDDKKQKEATATYAEATEIIKREVKAPAAEGEDPIEPEQPLPEDEKPITYASTAEQAQAVLDAVTKVEGGTAAASGAALLEARALLDLGKFDQALAKYKEQASSGPNELARTVAREGVGYALEARALATTDAAAREAGLRQALDAFRKVQPKEKGLRWLEGMYHEARLLATLGETDKANELYQKILDSEPSGALETSVSARVAMLAAGTPSMPPPPAPPAPPGSGDGDDSGEATPEAPPAGGADEGATDDGADTANP